MSTAPTLATPLSALAAFSYSGANALQCPHQGANTRVFRHLTVELDEPELARLQHLLSEILLRQLNNGRLRGVKRVG